MRLSAIWWRGALLAALAACVIALPAGAFENDRPLDDPAQEARARELSRTFRCLVCQNEPISDSSADLARDLRMIVRERISAGDSDAQVTEYLVARYGDFVLLDPPMKPKTYVLWFGPAGFALIAAGMVFLFFRRGTPARAAGSTELTSAEQARLDRLLEDDGKA